MDGSFWAGRRVFLTGHTGFKGSWLALWLHELGAEVTGYALAPPTSPSLYEVADVASVLRSELGDVRDHEQVAGAVQAARPDVVIHMAAQAIVRESYLHPAQTYATNVLGTVNLLDAVRHCDSVRAVVNVTTDKCYENREWVWGYRETDAMGGYDPYSGSKGCSEIATASMRSSYFNAGTYGRAHRVAVATARAGNVIGGGDWAADRLVPDCLRALLKGERILIRNPAAIRPWQHVLEPLSGYLVLAQRLVESGAAFAEAWNFGPPEGDERSVEHVVQRLCSLWGGGADYRLDTGEHPHEARTLRLDCSKARVRLGWRPRWTVEKALAAAAEWTRAYAEGQDVRAVCLRQMADYVGSAER